jgi:hypothetical protein
VVRLAGTRDHSVANVDALTYNTALLGEPTTSSSPPDGGDKITNITEHRHAAD